MILSLLFTLGFSVVVYNVGVMQGYELKEKDMKDQEEFWKEIEKHGV